MAITVGSKSDPGRHRRRNEDSILVALSVPGDRSRSLFAVADGMGGAPAGHKASAAAVATLEAGVRQHAAAPPREALAAAFDRANEAVRALSTSRRAYAGAGTTLVAALVERAEAWIANVGDSRAYLIRPASNEQITHDHSWMEEEIRAGVMTREDGIGSSFRHLLTRSIGGAVDVPVDVFGPIDLVEDDHIVPCSDGLHAHVAAEEVATIVNSRLPQAAAERLVDLANARGGADNISVIVVEVVAARNRGEQ